MNKKSLAFLVGASILTTTGAQAQGWTLLTVAEPGYRAKPALSLLYGRMTPSATGFRDGNFVGLEVAFDCPLLQPPTNRIREQLSYVHYSQGSRDIDSVEINPHYVVEVSPGLELGGGPGLAYILTNTPANDPSLWGLNLGLSAHYTPMDQLFLGAEYRYQITSDERFGNGINEDLNNGRFDIKLGYRF